MRLKDTLCKWAIYFVIISGETRQSLKREYKSSMLEIYYYFNDHI